MEPVYVLRISHRHGDDITVYASEDSAQKALADYCREYWNEVADSPDEPAPEDNEQLIETYFERYQASMSGSEEYYQLEQCPVFP